MPVVFGLLGSSDERLTVSCANVEKCDIEDVAESLGDSHRKQRGHFRTAWSGGPLPPSNREVVELRRGMEVEAAVVQLDNTLAI